MKPEEEITEKKVKLENQAITEDIEKLQKLLIERNKSNEKLKLAERLKSEERQRQRLIGLLHNDLRNPDNESAIYDYIQALQNIDPAISLVKYPNPIDLNNYPASHNRPSLATIILDSVRNEGGELIINENNLTVNSTNLILRGILDGLNAENPQFQELESLQISSNVEMNEESMNLLSEIIWPNSRITRLDIRNNNINPNHLNILLRNIVENPGRIANLQELDFSNNFINQASVPLLNAILVNNRHIFIGGENIIPRGVVLENLEHDQLLRFDTTPTNLSNDRTPDRSPDISGNSSPLFSSLNSNGRD